MFTTEIDDKASSPLQPQLSGLQGRSNSGFEFGKSNTMATRAVRWDLTDLTLDLAMHLRTRPVVCRTVVHSGSHATFGHLSSCQCGVCIWSGDRFSGPVSKGPGHLEEVRQTRDNASGSEKRQRKNGAMPQKREWPIPAFVLCPYLPSLLPRSYSVHSCTAFRSYCTLAIHVCRPQTDLSQRFLFLSPLRIRGL